MKAVHSAIYDSLIEHYPVHVRESALFELQHLRERAEVPYNLPIGFLPFRHLLGNPCGRSVSFKYMPRKFHVRPLLQLVEITARHRREVGFEAHQLDESRTVLEKIAHELATEPVGLPRIARGANHGHIGVF